MSSKRKPSRHKTGRKDKLWREIELKNVVIAAMAGYILSNADCWVYRPQYLFFYLFVFFLIVTFSMDFWIEERKERGSEKKNDRSRHDHRRCSGGAVCITVDERNGK